MGLCSTDIRIFYSCRARSWIIANDFKKRRLMDRGYDIEDAKKLSHGHISNEQTGERMKENILANKRTKSRDLYILKCYIRITDDSYRHYNWLKGLYDTKKNKTVQQYYNVGYKGV